MNDSLENWLEKIDGIYSNKVEEMNNSRFIYIFKVDFKLNHYKITSDLLFWKDGRKTKILLTDEYGRRLYLKDEDIIDMAVESKYTDTILKFLKELIEENTKDIIMNIFDENYSISCPQSFLGKNCCADIDTFADFRISLNSLLLLIMLIVSKEYFGRGEKRGVSQAKLLYMLISYYSTNAYNEELRELNYSILEYSNAKGLYQSFSSYSIRKKIIDDIGEIMI